jgi:ADP-heptose:LPS heptosyltransferase
VADQFTVSDLGPRLDEEAGAFMDTAAVMKNLDLVVTVDTALAHLAGALGVPVWLALSFNPDWRWMQGRDDSPWYPTMRLFRQRQPGNYAEVFTKMAERLLEKPVSPLPCAGNSP